MVAVNRGVIALLLVTLAALASGQITFSRDWTGGKRSPPGPQLAVDCGQFARLCRHFIHEMKEEMTGNIPDPASVKRRRLMEDPPIYEDE